MGNSVAEDKSQTYLCSPITAKVSQDGENGWSAYGVSSMQGWRVHQEDAYFCILDFDVNMSLFGIFDGHGGSEVAVLAVEKLPSLIKKNEAFKAGDYKSALKRAYMDFDEHLLTMDGYKQLKEIRDRISKKKRKKNDDGNEKISEDTRCGYYSGSTAVVALLVDKNTLYVANAGDSKCVVAVDGNVPVDMSKDHKPENEPELSRILNAGGTVVRGRINDVLNMSRAFGDHVYKANESYPMEEQIVIAKPDIKVRELKAENGDFIVIASDGVWEMMVSERVVNFISNCFQNDGIKISSICEQLMDKCLAPDNAKGGKGLDNMTVIVIRLKSHESDDDIQTDDNLSGCCGVLKLE